MWAVTMRQPDLSYAAHQLTKFSENPVPAHCKATRGAVLNGGRTSRFTRGERIHGTPVDERIAENRSSSTRTRHVEVKHHIIRDAIE